MTKHKAILIADDLFSRDPFIKLIEEIPDVDYIFVAKPTSHKYMTGWIKDLTIHDKAFVTVNEKIYASHCYDYEFARNLPLKDDKDTAKVNYFQMNSHTIKEVKNFTLIVL